MYSSYSHGSPVPSLHGILLTRRNSAKHIRLELRGGHHHHHHHRQIPRKIRHRKISSPPAALSDSGRLFVGVSQDIRDETLSNCGRLVRLGLSFGFSAAHGLRTCKHISCVRPTRVHFGPTNCSLSLGLLHTHFSGIRNCPPLPLPTYPNQTPQYLSVPSSGSNPGEVGEVEVAAACLARCTLAADGDGGSHRLSLAYQYPLPDSALHVWLKWVTPPFGRRAGDGTAAGSNCEHPDSVLALPCGHIAHPLCVWGGGPGGILKRRGD